MLCLIKGEAHPSEVSDLKVVVEAVDHCLRLKVVFGVAINTERLIVVVWREHASNCVDR